MVCILQASAVPGALAALLVLACLVQQGACGRVRLASHSAGSAASRRSLAQGARLALWSVCAGVRLPENGKQNLVQLSYKPVRSETAPPAFTPPHCEPQRPAVLAMCRFFQCWPAHPDAFVGALNARATGKAAPRTHGRPCSSAGPARPADSCQAAQLAEGPAHSGADSLGDTSRRSRCC